MLGLPLRVAVVGGGIGGLAAANALVHHDIDVTVYERAPRLGEIGAGVVLHPNGVRQLDDMGLGGAVAATGAALGDASHYFREDGTPVAPVRTSDSSGSAQGHGIHRADLLALLADALPAGTIRTGKECCGFRQEDGGATLEFADGTSAAADVVVAADGIHSVLQQHVVAPSRAVHSGSVAYRGLIEAERLPWWTRNALHLWMGGGKHFMVYPVRGGALLNYVAFVPSDEQAAESWSAPGDPEALAAAFAGWDSRVERLLDEVDTCFWWGLYDREPLERWSSGRLTLLGDAAHPMLPHLGQGANQAIEDGVALAVLLSARRDDVVGALREITRRYGARERPRSRSRREPTVVGTTPPTWIWPSATPRSRARWTSGSGCSTTTPRHGRARSPVPGSIDRRWRREPPSAPRQAGGRSGGRAMNRPTVDDVSGVFAIMPTPALPEASDPRCLDSVDHEESARGARALVDDGVSALMINGTFGEGAT